MSLLHTSLSDYGQKQALARQRLLAALVDRLAGPAPVRGGGSCSCALLLSSHHALPLLACHLPPPHPSLISSQVSTDDGTADADTPASAQLVAQCEAFLQRSTHLDTNPSHVEEQLDRLQERLGEHAQFGKQRALSLLRAHLLDLLQPPRSVAAGASQVRAAGRGWRRLCPNSAGRRALLSAVNPPGLSLPSLPVPTYAPHPTHPSPPQ